MLSYDAVFVGSVLEWLIVPSKSFKSFVRVALGKCVKPIKIWGAGFLAPESPNRWGGAKWLYRKVDIYALRGYKTKAAMEALLQVNLDSVVFGDPGLL